MLTMQAPDMLALLRMHATSWNLYLPDKMGHVV